MQLLEMFCRLNDKAEVSFYFTVPQFNLKKKGSIGPFFSKLLQWLLLRFDLKGKKTRWPPLKWKKIECCVYIGWSVGRGSS